MDLSVIVDGVKFKNPIVTASGPLGFGDEFFKYVSAEKIGGFTTKTVTPKPIQGNIPPRILYLENGLLNSIGLQNPGVEKFKEIAASLPKECVKIISVGGERPEDFAEVTSKIEEFADMIEINLSCPNIGGKTISSDFELTKSVLASCREVTKKPLIAKISPDVDPLIQSRIAIDAGVKIVNIGNSIQGMRINLKTGRPFLKGVKGGLSGPAFMPVILWKVYQVKDAFPDLSIIGLGGVRNASDIIEYAMAGSSLVGIGTQFMINPSSAVRIVDDLQNKIDSLKMNFADLIGISHRGGFI
ncbi:dihydroorotate dehydrogenase [Athalassotoga saccharophila]|uniref:dihydroorotate dehydrogenase n=1 Tax=Athalassotoga saccharophila TaxID=1441386 RepID=UPI00137A8B08|nr:dihydroorotate dehydrogenase [Athalassotoga saccharophila]BBJ27328.1 dihydroorotate dehydrogenase B (NAD(+)), catalytic subunit [Athalassotoga saccharophila]